MENLKELERYKMYVLALNGSHHKEGNTAYLLNRTLEACAEMGAETELLSLHQIMNGHHGYGL